MGAVNLADRNTGTVTFFIQTIFIRDNKLNSIKKLIKIIRSRVRGSARFVSALNQIQIRAKMHWIVATFP